MDRWERPTKSRRRRCWRKSGGIGARPARGAGARIADLEGLYSLALGFGSDPRCAGCLAEVLTAPPGSSGPTWKPTSRAVPVIGRLGRRYKSDAYSGDRREDRLRAARPRSRGLLGNAQDSLPTPRRPRNRQAEPKKCDLAKVEPRLWCSKCGKFLPGAGDIDKVGACRTCKTKPDQVDACVKSCFTCKMHEGRLTRSPAAAPRAAAWSGSSSPASSGAARSARRPGRRRGLQAQGREVRGKPVRFCSRSAGSPRRRGAPVTRDIVQR